MNDADQGDATMPGLRIVRHATAAVVVLVATIAAVVSYRHGLEVVQAAGETGGVAYLVPGSADGVIFAASMVILSANKTGQRVPWLAVAGLAFGIGATLAMNVAAGARHGLPGALVSALPAVALVVAYELLMVLVRGDRRDPASAPREDLGEPSADRCPHGVAASAEDAVRIAWLHGRDCVGEKPSQRQLAAAFGVNRNRVAELVRDLAEPVAAEPSLNGSGPDLTAVE